jgi:hypothetical protein
MAEQAQPQPQVQIFQVGGQIVDPADPAPHWLYTVVIAGAMVPRLHHPLWYRLIGAMTAEEADAALSSAVGMPNFSRFDAGIFEIFCQEQRWQIATTSRDKRERLLDVVRVVFDDRLKDTPVMAFGINTTANLKTDARNAPAVIGRIIAETDLGLPAAGLVQPMIVYEDATSDRKVTIGINAVPGIPARISVSYNVHHPVQVPADQPVFDVGELIREHYDADHQAGEDYSGALVERINRRAEVQSAGQ